MAYLASVLEESFALADPPPAASPRPRPAGPLRLLALLLLGAAVMAVTVWATMPGDDGIAMVGPAESAEGYRLWAERADGTAVRWDPCQPIDWVLNPAGAPDDAAQLVADAVSRVGAVTGLQFRYLGTTTEPPTDVRPTIDPDRYGRDWAPVLVAWTSPDSGTALRDTDQGVAVPVAVDGVFVTAQVLLNDQRWLSPDFAERSVSWGGVLVHEFGHVVGLDHVEDPSQLMYRYAGSGPVRFGAGDLAGFDAVGAGTGGGACLDAGRPRLVEVEVAGRR